MALTASETSIEKVKSPPDSVETLSASVPTIEPSSNTSTGAGAATATKSATGFTVTAIVAVSVPPKPSLTV